MITKRIIHLSTFTSLVNPSQSIKMKSLQSQQLSTFSVNKSSSMYGLNDITD